MSSLKTKVVIVGAGASGLTAARHLSQKGHGAEVVVLEAEDRLGGRIHTIPKNGKVLELGAQWIHGKEGNPLYDFAIEHEIPLSPVANRDGEGVFVRTDGNVIPEKLRQETEMKMEEIHEDLNKFANEMYQKSVPQSVGHYFQSEFEKWIKIKEFEGEDDESLLWRRQFFDWWKRWEECDAGCDSWFQQSAISWGQYVDYDSDTSFATGYETVIHKLVEGISQETKILKNHVVENIDWSGNYGNENIRIKCSNGLEIHCQFVILTMSLGFLKKHKSFLFIPDLPSNKSLAYDSFNFGTIDRIKLDFEEPFWNSDNPGFQILWREEDELSSEDKLSRDNWVRNVVGFDHVLDQPNMLMGWISGEPARFMESMNDDVIAQDLCDLLSKVTGKILPKLKTIDVTRWFSNPFQLGVYSYRSPTTDNDGVGIVDLMEPLRSKQTGLPVVLFAGEATDSEHYGTVHGAMQAGKREAGRILNFLS